MHPLATTPLVLPGETARGAGMRLLDAVTVGAGLKNCKLLVDIGDINSMADTSANTSLVDLSPEGASLQAGTASGADTEDPAVIGTAGALDTTYSVHDGVQDVTLADLYTFAVQPSWANNIHKDSALFSIGLLYYIDDVSDGNWIQGTATTPLDVGYRLFVNQATSGAFEAWDGSGFAALVESTAIAAPSLQAWHFLGLSLDEAAGTGFWYIDGVEDAFTSTYDTPSASAALNGFTLGCSNKSTPFSAQAINCRFGGEFFFEGRALTTSEFRRIFERIRHRYGI